MRWIITITVLASLVGSNAWAQSTFTNWENPHVHPLDITPDAARLLAVNTADNRLEVFDLSPGLPVKIGSVFVGLDPVSVRARSNTEAWVISHISDSIEIVDLDSLRVVRSIRTDDEPCDVVFGASPARAFVSCSQANTILVYDLSNLTTAPTRLTLLGEDPRALVFNPARNEVYVAIFESGNKSTILGGGSLISNGFPPNVVNDSASPYFNASQPLQVGLNPPNPPPNDGVNFKPAINPAYLPGGATPAPRVSLIVKKSSAGQWMDDNVHDWTAVVSGANAARSGRLVGWDLYDHDVAIINASSLAVSYATGCMNIGMALSLNPASGQVTLVGTDATNEIRYEPVLRGRFLRVNMARFDPASPSAVVVNDLNAHLTYTSVIPFVPIEQAERDQSIGDPRGIAWNAAGTRGYVTGMGSNNLIVINSSGTRAGLAPTIEVGEGPTGIVLDESRNQAYVLNKFEASISTISTLSETELLPRTPLFDPTPAAIKIGRKHLYSTHDNSGLGHIACASCHVDARMDRLAWDLGDPSGAIKTFNNFGPGTNCPSGDCENCADGNCQNWHAMKGPMTSQSLQDIIGKEPHHWRGDRDGLEEFAGAFQGLQGDDAPLPPAEMQEFENFLGTIHYPPNPFRNFDNTLPSSVPLTGHFATGRYATTGGLAAGTQLPNGSAIGAFSAYRTALLDGGAVNCVTCHTLPTGAGTNTVLVGSTFTQIPVGPNGERHLALVSVDGSTNLGIKIPQLRNEYEKTGFDLTKLRNTAGFGFLHDGSVDSIARFVDEPVFTTPSDQATADLVALMLAFSGSAFTPGPFPTEPPGVVGQDTPAAVGWQTTLIDDTAPAPGQLTLISNMIARANTNTVGLVVKGRVGGIARGYRYNGSNTFQSDRAGETITAAALQAAAQSGSELTYTVVVKGSETRIGIDRDLDGFFDRSEIEACRDPADPTNSPATPPSADIDGDGEKDAADVAAFVAVLLGQPLHPAHPARCDLNCDAAADGRDAAFFIEGYLAP